MQTNGERESARCSPGAAAAPSIAVSRSFDAKPASVAEARGFALQVLTGRVDSEVLALLVSELATNALHHARTTFEVTIALDGGVAHVEVSDGSADLPQRTPTDDPLRRGGRGLLLVEVLALAWGYRPTGNGKTVWFELAAEGGGG